MIAALVAHQLRLLRRQHVFAVLLGAFVLMSVMAGVLGYSSSRTIVRVYDDAAKMLAAAGRPAPPNPFLLKPTLAMLSNMTVYIPFIGALLAVVLGHVSISTDDSGGVGRLVFARPVDRSGYVLAKVIAVAVALAGVIAPSLVLSAAAILWVNGSISPGNLGRLTSYYALSWLYLLPFALVGILTALSTRRRSMALLSAMAVWLVITFVLPQLTSGLHPVASLNPITRTLDNSQGIFAVTSHLRPLSFAESYKAASGVILQTADGASAPLVSQVLPLVGLLAGCLLLALRLAHRHDFSRSGTHE